MSVELPIGDPEVIARRHADSKRRFPSVVIDDDEYVVAFSKRHPLWVCLGLFWRGWFHLYWSLVFGLRSVLCPIIWTLLRLPKNSLSLGAVAILVLITVFSYIGLMIYRRNQLIITNERIIQKISMGLFDQRRQTISLEAIEDISYHQKAWCRICFSTAQFVWVQLATNPHTPLLGCLKPHKYTDFLGDVVEDARENQFVTDEMMEIGRKLSWWNISRVKIEPRYYSRFFFIKSSFL